MLKINLENLTFRCIIGVYRHERQKKQPLRIDAQLLYEHAAADQICRSDTIEQGIDYVRVSELICTTATTGRFLTLEALCASVVADVLDAFPAASEIWLRVQKPRALPGSAVAGVEYQAKRTAEQQTRPQK